VKVVISILLPFLPCIVGVLILTLLNTTEFPDEQIVTPFIYFSVSPLLWIPFLLIFRLKFSLLKSLVVAGISPWLTAIPIALIPTNLQNYLLLGDGDIYIYFYTIIAANLLTLGLVHLFGKSKLGLKISYPQQAIAPKDES
jgi:hypothetical protein